MRYAFRLGFAAIVLIFLLPGNLMQYLGLYSDTPGGNPLTKFHPATYLMTLAVWFALYGRRHGGGVSRAFRERPALAWSIVLIGFCMFYSAVNIGISGLAVYVETFLVAALGAIALETGTERQRRILGYTILTFCLVNVGIALLEGRFENHLVPSLPPSDMTAAQMAFEAQVDEFRGQAFYPHPLTGALVTSMGLFLVLGMRLRSWLAAAVFGVLVVGLLSFGGRSALATTLFMIAAAALFQLAAGLVTRRLNIGFLAAFVAGAVLLPVLFVVLTTMSDIGMRIMSHLYADDSFDVRIIQWRVLDLINVRDALFGMSPERIDLLKAQVGLTGSVGADIENPWLLMFLNLGFVGFPFLVAAIFLLMLHLGRQSETPIGWLLVTATLLICSTSNSLGHKTPDLIFLVGFMEALGGFKPERYEQQQPAEAAAPDEVPVIHTSLAIAPQRRRVGVLTDRPGRRVIRAVRS
jgi:hypothetical protein